MHPLSSAHGVVRLCVSTALLLLLLASTQVSASSLAYADAPKPLTKDGMKLPLWVDVLTSLRDPFEYYSETSFSFFPKPLPMSDENKDNAPSIMYNLFSYRLERGSFELRLGKPPKPQEKRLPDGTVLMDGGCYYTGGGGRGIVLTKQGLIELRTLVTDGFRVNLIINDLPNISPLPGSAASAADADVDKPLAGPKVGDGVKAGAPSDNTDEAPRIDQPDYWYGFPVGSVAQELDYDDDGIVDVLNIEINNYVEITLHLDVDKRPVVFETRASSRHSCHDLTPMLVRPGQNISFMVSVKLLYDAKDGKGEALLWKDRWAAYADLVDPTPDIKYIMLGIVLGFFVIGTCCGGWCFRRRFQKSVRTPVAAARGWKTLRREVFKLPKHPSLLAACVGTGVQLIFLLFIMLIVGSSLTGPWSGGVAATVVTGCYAPTGLLVGLMIGGLIEAWEANSSCRAITYSAFVFPFPVALLGLAIFFAGSGARAAISPVVAVVVAFFLWVGFIVFVWFGNKIARKCCFSRRRRSRARVNVAPVKGDPDTGDVEQHGLLDESDLDGPSRWCFCCCARTQFLLPHAPMGSTAQLRSPRPEYSRCRLGMQACIIVGGVSFVILLTPVMFALDSVWGHTLYLLFGIIAVFIIIWLIAAGVMAIIILHSQLEGEDSAWEWFSFITSGAVGAVVFSFCLVYFFVQTRIADLASQIVFLGYVGILSFGLFLIQGSVGYLCNRRFAVYMYSKKWMRAD